jgi:hypothetical protein
MSFGSFIKVCDGIFGLQMLLDMNVLIIMLQSGFINVISLSLRDFMLLLESSLLLLPSLPLFICYETSFNDIIEESPLTIELQNYHELCNTRHKGKNAFTS